MLKIVGKGIYGPFGGWEEFNKIVATDSPLFSTSIGIPPKEQGLVRFVSGKFLRRLDHFTKMTLLAGHLALEDMYENFDLNTGRLGIILTTGYGPCQTTFDFLDSMLKDGPQLASPLAFSHSVHNVPVGILAMSLQKKCPCLTICQPYLPLSSGLTQAWTWLKCNMVDTVLLGAIDEDTALLRYCKQRMHADLKPENTLIQEGAVFLCLREDQGETKGFNLGLPVVINKNETLPIGLYTKDKKGELDFFQLKGIYPTFPVAAAFSLAASLTEAMKTCKGYVLEGWPKGPTYKISVQSKANHDKV